MFQNVSDIDALESELAGTWELKDDIGDVWERVNECLTVLRVEKESVYGHLLKRMIDLSVSQDVVKLAGVIREFDQLLSRHEQPASHYILHVVDPLLQRAAAVRTLGSIRAVQENSLLKVNADGTKQLDHKATEMLLKVVALQEKAIATLDAARMPPPPRR